MKSFPRFSALIAGVALIFAVSGAAIAAEPDQSVTVKAGDTMRFDVTKIEAVAGTTIAITLENTGKLPKAAMGHNLVVLTKDANAAKFANAAMMARDAEYIPAAMTDSIVAHTKLLGPGESDTITFTVPSEPGNYVFLCSFPAHFMAGMRGTIVVSAP
ncbi:plastocyanin/azurin family copper-binding protein [Synoicihabitans lomoniglobus]|uniref:Plastocyanin/azurin family copper-binding protein n=1 Tax=Synoicihabitans lomoniglobus TaxID=2909285 RepID=A0AAE9ZRY1_9BACT|nr:plastocyanin/azurin family copper-binding protein [Opitutaceae bacterium LMO-M01]WED63087.1 plastocyanin/azurin family copper-binding protein [Opitutaceae bacterium LMO-M01]